MEAEQNCIRVPRGGLLSERWPQSALNPLETIKISSEGFYRNFDTPRKRNAGYLPLQRERYKTKEYRKLFLTTIKNVRSKACICGSC